MAEHGLIATDAPSDIHGAREAFLTPAIVLAMAAIIPVLLGWPRTPLLTVAYHGAVAALVLIPGVMSLAARPPGSAWPVVVLHYKQMASLVLGTGHLLLAASVIVG